MRCRRTQSRPGGSDQGRRAAGLSADAVNAMPNCTLDEVPSGLTVSTKKWSRVRSNISDVFNVILYGPGATASRIERCHPRRSRPSQAYRRLRVDQRDRLSRHAGFVLVERAVPIPAVEHTARDLTVAGRPRLLRRPWGDRALFCDSFEAPPEQPDNARTEEKNGPSDASFGANIAYACRLRADHEPSTLR